MDVMKSAAPDFIMHVIFCCATASYYWYYFDLRHFSDPSHYWISDCVHGTVSLLHICIFMAIRDIVAELSPGPFKVKLDPSQFNNHDNNHYHILKMKII